MGLYIRKSIKVGGVRLNLSKSGVGVSLGVKGFRVGSGPGGAYVHMGRGGVYYRKRLGGGGGRRRTAPAARSGAHRSGTAPPRAQPPMPEVVDRERIDSGPVTAMVPAEAAELLTELEVRGRRPRLAPLVKYLGPVGLGTLLLADFPTPALWGAALAVLVLYGWLRHLDRERRTLALFYDLEPEVAGAYEALLAAFRAWTGCAAVWLVEARGRIVNPKYAGGSREHLERQRVRPRLGAPEGLALNLDVPLLPVGSQMLVFLPDRLLVRAPEGWGAVSYDELRVDVAERELVEEAGTPPADAEVVRHTWRYVNKDGGPDRRFRDNERLPVCRYEWIRFSSPSGLDELLLLSRVGPGRQLGEALARLATVAGGTASTAEEH